MVGEFDAGIDRGRLIVAPQLQGRVHECSDDEVLGVAAALQRIEAGGHVRLGDGEIADREMDERRVAERVRAHQANTGGAGKLE